MSAPCCGHARTVTPPRGLARRALGMFRWALPGITLVLMPKCPACLAGYIALWTGIGLSITAAYYLRIGIMALCVLAIVALSATLVYRAVARHAPARGPAGR